MLGFLLCQELQAPVQGFHPPAALDPRIEAPACRDVTDMGAYSDLGCHCPPLWSAPLQREDPLTTVCAGSDGLVSHLPHTLNLSHMDSFGNGSVYGNRSDTVNIPDTPQAARGNICELSDDFECTVCTVRTACTTQRADEGAPLSSLGQTLPSCLKGSRSFKGSQRVRFNFSIDFWFPAADQCTLPCASPSQLTEHVGFRSSHCFREEAGNNLCVAQPIRSLEALIPSFADCELFSHGHVTTPEHTSALVVPSLCSRPSENIKIFHDIGHDVTASSDLSKGGSCRTLADRNTRPCWPDLHGKAPTGFCMSLREPVQGKSFPCAPCESFEIFQDSQSDGLPLPLQSYTEPPTCQILCDITNQSGSCLQPLLTKDEHVGFRSPDIVACNHTDTVLFGLSTFDQAEHVGFRSPYHIAHSKVPSSSDCPNSLPTQPASKAKACGKLFQTSLGATLPNPPSGVPRPDRFEVRPKLSPTPIILTGEEDRNAVERFTSFDAVNQHVVLRKDEGWNADRCLQEAVARSDLPLPAGRVSRFNVQGFPVPQIIVSQTAMTHTHRTVILVFTGFDDASEGAVFVADIPTWVTPYDFLFNNRRHSSLVQRMLICNEGMSCLVNGLPGDCHSVIRRDTDVIHFYSGTSATYSWDVLSVAPQVRPPTPPLPPGVWPSGVLRGDSSSSSTAATSRAQHAQLDDASPAEFVVFDVYHHARIIDCHDSDTDERLVMLALQATPEIGSVFSWRRVRYTLPGLPRRQIVLWGDCLPSSVILPIAFGSGRSAICTIEAIRAYSALQIVTLACRACQLPSFLLQGVADSESTLWINERRLYPLDPNAGEGADSARLLGYGVSAFTADRPSQDRRSPSITSSAQEARDFLRSLDDSQIGDSSHFTIFVEPATVQLLPLPDGASLAELVYRAFGQFPGLSARCGHRILSRPLPGLPPIQVCIWDNLGADQRVLQVVIGDNPAEILTVRCPAVGTPLQLVTSASSHDLNAFADSIAGRTHHISGDGMPLQPTQVYLFRHFEVLRVRQGPPPTRLPSARRFYRSPLPECLECLSGTDISDGEVLDQIVVHQQGAPPVTIQVDPVRRPALASFDATTATGTPASWRLHFPLTAPLAAGTLPHAVLGGSTPLAGGSFAICDLRRILRPPISPFITLQLPAIVTPQVLQNLLAPVLPHLAPYRAIYLDQNRLDQATSIGGTACTVTFIGWHPRSFSWQSEVMPAVLDTLMAITSREGFLHAFARAHTRSRLSDTSTTTTGFCDLPPSSALPTSTTTTRPSAGTGSLGSTDSSASTEGGASASGSASAAPHAAGPSTDLATNPDLLDFVTDPLAIHRLDPSELPKAYTLFDSVYQSRLAYRDISWSVADCLVEAARHFRHLGPGAILSVLANEVEGLPSPQIVAIAAHSHPRLKAFPIDARPVGHGICVVDAPSSTTPYTAVYWATSLCPLHGLPPRVARGTISARAFGRHLPPFVEVARQVDSICLCGDSVPFAPASRSTASPLAAAETILELRDLAAETFLHSSDVPIMLHLPGGPPIQAFIQKHHSLLDIEMAASIAVWHLSFHSAIRLHLPGTFPRGTDAVLHFLVELDGRCTSGSTIYLFDGRPLVPTGPPFRSAILPRRITLLALLEAAQKLFPEARMANALRVNGRLVTRWEARDYVFPLVRLLNTGGSSSDLPPLDCSSLPALEMANLFPGLALAYQCNWQGDGEFVATSSHEVVQLPPRRPIETSVSTEGADDPLPFVLEVPQPPPSLHQAEVVVLSLHFPAFRLWFPNAFTMHQLHCAIAQGLGVPVQVLRWPRVTPCIAGSPLFAIASLPSDNAHATLGIVDARRVHPVQGPAIWLVTLPATMQSSELNAHVLSGRQVISTPQYTRVDGRRHVGSLRFRQGIFVLTVSTGLCDSENCIDWQHHSDFPLGLQMTFPPQALPATSTTSTTLGCQAPFIEFVSTTSTTSTVGAGFLPRVTFYITSGLFQPLVLHAGDYLSCAELLATAAFHFFERRISPPVSTWILSKRAFQLSNGRWAIFLFTGHATHEPALAAIWIDTGNAWPHPYMIHVPAFATWAQVKARIFVRLADAATVTVNGVIWHGERRFFANGFVLQIRLDPESLISRPLLQFTDRFPGLSALQFPCDGPSTDGWHDIPPTEQRHRFLCHFRRCLAKLKKVSVCTPPFSPVLLYVQGFGSFRFTAGTLLPAHAVDVQHYFDCFLSAVAGAGVVQDLKYVWDDCCLFVVRQPTWSDALWIQLDGDNVDFWELDASQDLSQIPTRCGYTLYPTDRSGSLGYAIRRHLTEVEASADVPGPSRLRDVIDPHEAEVRALHTVFGTPPDTEPSSLDSSERALLAGSDSSASAKSDNIDSPSSADSPSLAPAADQISLIQMATRLKANQGPVSMAHCSSDATSSHSSRKLSCDVSATADTKSHPISVRVFRPGLPTASFNLRPMDTLRDFFLHLHSQPEATHNQVLPVFPQAGPHFDCIVFPAVGPSEAIPVLIEPFGRDAQACGLLPGITGQDIIQQFSPLGGELLFHGLPWHDSSTGWIPGMRLVLQPAPASLQLADHDVAVGETIPQTSAAMPLCGSQGFAKDARARAPAVNGRPVSTPMQGRAAPTPICLADLVTPPPPAISIGVEASMLEFCLEAHSPEALAISLPISARICAQTRAFWDSLPSFNGSVFDEVFIFTDGSFDPHTQVAGWAVVLLGMHNKQVYKLGYAHGRACSHTATCNAFHAEMEALLHGHAFASRLRAGCVHIAVDCSAALQVGNGLACFQAEDTVGRACLGLQFATGSGAPRRQHKVTAHNQCLPNELADGLAKASVFDNCCWPSPAQFRPFWDAVQERVFDWLWVATCPPSSQLPFLSPEGNWSMAACAAPTSTSPSELGLVQPSAASSMPYYVDLRVIQYNCLSMQGQAAAELICKGLQRHKVAVAGFQDPPPRGWHPSGGPLLGGIGSMPHQWPRRLSGLD